MIVQDRSEIEAKLKNIFMSGSRYKTMNYFIELKNRRSSKYPRPLYSIEKNLNALLQYCYYPGTLRISILFTNLIEGSNKEIRKRIKIIDSLPS